MKAFVLLLVLCLILGVADSARRWKNRRNRENKNTENSVRSGVNDNRGDSFPAEHDASDDDNGAQDGNSNNAAEITGNGCPQGWIPLPRLGKCYWIPTTATNHSHAQAICEEKGGVLWSKPSTVKGGEEQDNEEEDNDVQLEDQDEDENDDQEVQEEVEEEGDDQQREHAEGEHAEGNAGNDQQREHAEGEHAEGNAGNDQQREHAEGEHAEGNAGDDQQREHAEGEHAEGNAGDDQQREQAEGEHAEGNAGDDQPDPEEIEEGGGLDTEDTEPANVDINGTRESVRQLVIDALGVFSEDDEKDDACANAEAILHKIATIVSDDSGIIGQQIEGDQPIVDVIDSFKKYFPKKTHGGFYMSNAVEPVNEADDATPSRKKRHSRVGSSGHWIASEKPATTEDMCLEAIAGAGGRAVLEWTNCSQDLLFVCEIGMKPIVASGMPGGGWSIGRGGGWRNGRVGMIRPMRNGQRAGPRPRKYPNYHRQPDLHHG